VKGKHLKGICFAAQSAFRSRRLGLVICVVAGGLLACDEEVQQSGRGVSGGGPGASATTKPASAQQQEGLVLKDDDFTESERHRDPFRSYTAAARAQVAEAAPDSQRLVIMPDTAVEDMKLIAVISGLDRPKAMLVDPAQVGYVVQRGDYIGKPKVFQSTGSVAMTLNWRVDRIRENEVVLTRQDPSELGRPPMSRIISMRDEVAAR
jgi:type IV pilus assembly protein PilP